mmetsp:Transcript_2165/g.4791  ORF Transcript_2165/g.4791 Transcript_2165/m.4791 type:complete len:279 (-) Transcript_2165:23-859(-)
MHTVVFSVAAALVGTLDKGRSKETATITGRCCCSPARVPLQKGNRKQVLWILLLRLLLLPRWIVRLLLLWSFRIMIIMVIIRRHRPSMIPRQRFHDPLLGRNGLIVNDQMFQHVSRHIAAGPVQFVHRNAIHVLELSSNTKKQLPRLQHGIPVNANAPLGGIVTQTHAGESRTRRTVQHLDQGVQERKGLLVIAQAVHLHAGRVRKFHTLTIVQAVVGIAHQEVAIGIVVSQHVQRPAHVEFKINFGAVLVNVMLFQILVELIVSLVHVVVVVVLVRS